MSTYLPPHQPTRDSLRYLVGSAEQNAGGVFEYVRLLYRRKFLFVGTVATVFLLAVAFTLLQRPMHRAFASLEVQPGNQEFLNLQAVDPMARVTAGDSAESFLNTQAQVIRQDSLLEEVARKLKLQPNPLFFPPMPLGDRVRAMFGMKHTRPEPSAEYTLYLLQSHVNVAPVKQSRIIRISYESPDPQIAASVVNTLVEAYVQYTSKSRWDKTRQTADSLEPQLVALRAALEQSELSLQEYARRTDLIISPGRASAADDKLRQLQTELLTAQADRIAKQAAFDMASRMPAESVVAVVDSQVARDYQVKLTELRRQYADLTSVLNPESYKVARLKAQIAELETALINEIALALNRLRSNFESAKNRESLLSNAYQSQTATLSSHELKAIRYNMIKREADTNRQMYEAMLHRYKEAKVASAVQPSNVQVIDWARKPTAPFSPNVPVNLATGFAAGIFLAVGVVVCVSQNDRYLRTPGETEALLNLPELGVIPMADLKPVRAARVGQGLLESGSSTSTAVVPARSVELVAWNERVSRISESFRDTMASLLSMIGYADHPGVVVITSPQSGEGKTTVASNLAIVLAETRRRVVLIDGDMRRPRLQKIFDVPNNWGLSNLLRDDTLQPDQSIERLTRKTSVPGLYLIPSGPGTDSFTNLLYSPKMAQLIRRLREEFDQVIIDAPPILECSDARIMARHADGVVLVFRAGRTHRAMASAAMHRLVGDNIPVIGSVLNNWRAPTGDTYGYYSTPQVY